MNHYRVKIEAELLAPSPRKAAQQAFEAIKELTEQQATFSVQDTISGKVTKVSLRSRALSKDKRGISPK